MKVASSMALGILLAAGGIPARAGALTLEANPRRLALEVESQVPCFFFGG